MKALVLKDYKQLEVATMPDPEIGPEEVLVRVKACGICGSDVHGYDGHTGRRIPPLIMGHEASGVIAQSGGNVKQFRPGDRVTFDSTVYCGKCFYCRRGDVNLCDNRNVLGVSCGEYRRHGAFAEFVAVPQHIVYRLPDDLGFEQAALIESVSIAFHATNRTPMKLGDSVVVVGAGMIGQLVVQAVRQAGCGKLIAIDLDERKLQMARQLGADAGINANSPDVQAQVLELTQGRGADLAFEVVGASAPFNTSVASLRKGGSVTLVGNLSPKVEMPLQHIVTRELTLIGVCASSGEYPACIDLMARGRIDVSAFISAFAPLEEGPMWFDRLYRQEPGLMKVVLKPT
ncbi:MAG: galactitol-1-phosphate 5-dehydrogenase [Acidobacteria bacterium]|nr:galactitol-1-phosphate 5-dehydrogenase [Acidobacteriota bacterium]MCI0628963.1 galactitol-1-phosphate 5-dehydrogenase [Acidobacteriota bacterium]MCI0719492.1 galactitol-1-phosphate 5-dehydrogenase [Acidobacteriota bacterium]